MRRANSLNHPKITRLCLAMICYWVAWATIPRAEPEPQRDQKPETPTDQRGFKAYGFDNTRFFSDPTGEDWVKISATGRREFIGEINPERTALVIIDLQVGCCKWGEALATHDQEVGQTYTDRMYNKVLPNVARMLKLFRDKDMLIVYTMLGKDDTFPEIIAPSEQRIAKRREFIVNKYSAGAFATSSIDNVLRENGIATLLICGTDTSACVLCTTTGAYDLAYQAILIEDACVGSRMELHEAAIKLWTYLGFVRTTDQVLDDFPWQKWVAPKPGADAADAQD